MELGWWVFICIARGGPPWAALFRRPQILFEKAQQEGQKYLDLQISGPKGGSTSQRTIDKALKSQLKAKQDGLKNTVEKYTEVVTMNGGEWKLAAVVEIGKAYDKLRKTNENQGRPRK